MRNQRLTSEKVVFAEHFAVALFFRNTDLHRKFKTSSEKKLLECLSYIFKPVSFQEKGFIVSCESICPDVCCRRSEDTGRKVTFST